MAKVYKVTEHGGVTINFDGGDVDALQGFLTMPEARCVCEHRGGPWTIPEYLEHHAENGIHEIRIML